MTTEAIYSYDDPGFPDFYDALLNFFTGGKQDAIDPELKSLVDKTLRSSTASQVCFLDLATGTGKVILSLLHLLRLEPLKDKQVLIVGTDMSSEMLDAARLKFARVEVPSNVKIELIQAPLQFPLPEHLNDSVDLAYCAAGTWTHLLTREEQLACLNSIKSVLKPGDGVAGMTIMSALDVGIRPPLASPQLSVPGVWEGGFKAPSAADPSKTWHRNMTKQELQRVDEGQGEPAALVAYEFDTKLVAADGNVVKDMNDGWTLRYCSPAEFCGLVKEAGMQVVDGGINLPDEATRTDDWLVTFHKPQDV